MDFILQNINKVNIGKIPIMLRSSICVLTQYSHLSSRILGECHNRSLDAMHAEEDAIRKCRKLNIDIKNIHIIIWKENSLGVKPAFSCNWCRKFILKNNLPIKKFLNKPRSPKTAKSNSEWI